MSSRKKIYFVVPNMVGGGAERVASIILSWLDRQKFSITLVLFNKIGEYLNTIPHDVEIIDLNKRSQWDFIKLIFKLRRIIEKENPHILFSYLHYTNIIAVLSGLFLKNDTRIIISEHSYHRQYLLHENFRALKRLLMEFTYNRANKIIACSLGVRQALIEDFNINSSKVVSISNPINIEEIQDLMEERVSHPFFNKAGNSFVLISVGRLTLAKNFSLLIKAFARVVKEVPAYLLILGQGELENDLRTLTRQLSLEKLVDFVGFQKNPFSWMKRADLFVLSSNWEGMPLVLIQAMACGMPVISTCYPSGPDEIITDGVNGFLVPVDDVEALSEQILRLIKDDNLRKQIAEQSKKRALDFDIGRIVKMYEKCFEEI